MSRAASIRKERDRKLRDAASTAQMALWNIAGVLTLALDYEALTAPSFPDELAAAMRLALSEATRASKELDVAT